MSPIPEKFIRYFNDKQQSVLESVMKATDTPGDILYQLGVAVPPEPAMQWLSLRDFFAQFGAEVFLKRINEFKPTHIKGREHIQEQDIRISTELPKIRFDAEETAVVRKRVVKENNVRSTKKVPFRRSEIIAEEKKEPAVQKPAEVEVTEPIAPAESVDVVEIEVQQEPLGEPTGDWDGKSERRSGQDRRKNDRRAAVDVIFKNKRFGKDRRSGEDRRKKK